MHKLVKQKTLFQHFLNMSLVHWFPFRLLSIHIKVGTNLEAQFLRLFIFCPATWTGWFRSTLGFDLLGFRSILVSICTRYQFQTAHYSIYTNSDLHSFRSALFSLCNFWICKDFALLSIRSAQISICTDFDLHVF